MGEEQEPFSYNSKAENSGLALIFYVDKFEEKEYSAFRLDADRLKEELIKFGFNVKIFSNLTQVEAIKVLKDISQENEVEEKDDLSSRENNETMSPKKFKPNFKNDKCFLAVFISHGISGLIKMKEDFLSVQNDILRHFRGNNCKNLLEKPKIFIFGNCQGKERQTPIEKPSSDIQTDDNMHSCGADDEGEASIFIPAGADFLLCYAAENSTAAFFDKNEGSWYIQSIVKALQEMVQDKAIGTDSDFVSLMTTVSEKVGEFSRERNKKTQVQIPYFVSTLRSKVYLPLPAFKDQVQGNTVVSQEVEEGKEVEKN